MAKQNADIEVPEANTAGSKSRLIIIVTVVVLVLAISAAATLLLSGALSGGSDAAADAGADAAPGEKATRMPAKTPMSYVPLDPPFVVNFHGDGSDVRFLQLSIEVGTRDAAVVERIKVHGPAIRNSLIMLFSSQDPLALNAREGKEKLRAETLAEVQKVLKQETGSAGVESVFFTGFVMQ